MTDKLPPNLAALFAPRPPLRYLKPLDPPPEKRCTAKIDGLAKYLPALQTYKETDVYTPSESWLDKRDRKRLEKKETVKAMLESAPKLFKPHEDPNIRGDPFKTLIAARLSYDVNEHDLEKAFGRCGPIERIRIIANNQTNSKPNDKKKDKPHRGYAFVVFEREKDMKGALQACDGVRIKDRCIKVDVERGRTVKEWKPRRLGGGLGGRNYTKTMPSRPMGPGGFGGGFRGGYRGFEGGPRGGLRGGFGGRGGGGGPRGGDRGPNRFGGGAPSNAPSGPGGSRGYDHGFGGRSSDDRSGAGGGYGGRFGDRGAGSGAGSGSNTEPIRPRERHRDGNRASREPWEGRDGRDGRSGRHGRDDRDDRRDRDRGFRDRDLDHGDRDRGGGRDRDGKDRDGRNGGHRGDDDSRKRGYDGDDRDPRKIRRY